MPNSYVNAFSEIGDYSILNSSANIEHECKIGKGTHIMSGACIGGRCEIEDFVSIGTNGLAVKRGCCPAAIETIIVSPIALEKARITEIVTPEAAAGKTTLKEV